MMTSKGKRHSGEFKAKVALALKGLKTVNELAAGYGVHPTQISQWKRQLGAEAKEIFGSRRLKEAQNQEMVQASLYEEIGRLKMELDWVKKLQASGEEKRLWIDPGHPELSIRRQCALLGLSRASYYYEPAQESPADLALMRRIDAQYTRTPFYGSQRMTVCLCKQGYGVNRKRAQRLMRQMGLWGIAPGPRTSPAHPGHAVCPYLLRDVVVERPNQVWSTDITYIPMRAGFIFLVAILDWYSCYVLSWGLSNTLDTVFCLEALEEALIAGRPEIFNTDQGRQFTSAPFTGVLEAHEVRISMDGRGRVFDEARPREWACLAP